MDGDSTDDTKNLLDELKPPFRVIIEKDEGVYDAMNKGIKASKGEWLYFLGADDKLFSATTLNTIFADEIPEETVLIIGAIVYDFKTDDSKFVKQNKGIFRPNWSSKLWIKNTVHHQGAFYKRHLFDNSGYNMNYKILADYDFNLKLFKAGARADIIDVVVAKCGTSGISKNYDWKLYQEEIALKSKYANPLSKPFLYILGSAKYLLKKLI